MGFDPQKMSFVEAMHALSGKQTTRKRCQEALCPFVGYVGEENNGNNGFLSEQDGVHSQ
ncbi:hypothetical protein RchiOBHm_Chr6g0293101 [Rosa chinensis]|uniref:Uncharacterized protein n=1 Tax=Rosa chinensis TaxID=74649 RepID=A0A2P6PWJ6_ROSCH|nr:hypothetical protein RchiOBHm_Chr6g0293101 [Rosa chinensis]